MNSFWPLLIVGASGLQVARNAAQRGLTEKLGLWGATYVRFVFGLPFSLLWVAFIILWRGYSGAPNWAFWAWVVLGAAMQAGATAGVVLAMRGRAFAVATAFTKTEAIGSALLGVAIIHDVITPGDWFGIILGTAGIGAGVLFSISSVAYRASAQSWGGDPWVGAAATLISTLFVQSLFGGILMAIYVRPKLDIMLSAWRECLLPGATGAGASALILSGFALGPSAGAVKAVQLIDVIIAWGVSHRLFVERIRIGEAIGMAMIVIGALFVAL
jgi:uncharacterized membrane protein